MRFVFTLISFWLTFVLSLAGWWLYFGMSILSKAPELLAQDDLVRHQKMLFQEGCVLMVFLLGGGLGLFYFAYRMHKEKIVKEKFFASFTHDLKTALFRLQLQIEKIGQDVGEEKVSPVLVQTRKIHLDLENGLDSTIGNKKELYIEKIDMNNFLSELHAQWPEFHIKLQGKPAHVLADKKALHSVFKNLLHNSFFHGEAGQIFISINEEKKNIKIEYSDNGNPFKGDVDNLGVVPQQSIEGSGFGLYIIRYWVEKMNGLIQFNHSDSGGLGVQIYLPGGLEL